jgi:hypothetical protein
LAEATDDSKVEDRSTTAATAGVHGRSAESFWWTDGRSRLVGWLMAARVWIAMMDVMVDGDRVHPQQVADPSHKR